MICVALEPSILKLAHPILPSLASSMSVSMSQDSLEPDPVARSTQSALAARHGCPCTSNKTRTRLHLSDDGSAQLLVMVMVMEPCCISWDTMSSISHKARLPKRTRHHVVFWRNLRIDSKDDSGR